MPIHRRKRSPSLYVWHRYIGLMALGFVVVLAVTGIALNHTGLLKLRDQYVNSEYLLDWYGIAAPTEFRAFALGDRWIVGISDHLFLDRRHLLHDADGLIGAVKTESLLLVALKNELLLLTDSGKLVDRLSSVHGVPAGLSAVGLSTEGTLYARGSHGIYQADKSLLEWQHPREVPEIAWSVASDPPSLLLEDLKIEVRHLVLNWERVMLDVHSGRIFGRFGHLIMDAAAGLLMFLSLSGFWLWLRQKRKMRSHNKKRGR